MSKFDENLELYKKSFKEKLKRKNFDEGLLRAIASSLGPSIYNKDAAKVACSDKKELEKIKKNFLIKKLGLSKQDNLDEAIKEVCNEMGSSNRNKYRVVFYYLLVEKFNKQEFFSTVKSKQRASSSSSSTQNQEAPKSKGTDGKGTDGKATDGKGKDEKGKDRKRKSEKGKNKSTRESHEIIHDYALYAAGVGFIPIPLVDLVSISAVQYKMIKKIAQNHDHVSFEKEKAKSVIAGLMGGIGSFELGIFARLVFKGIPFIGPIVGGTAMSGFAYASTKLIGEIFDEHFASGGNFGIEELTLQKMRDTFRTDLGKWKQS